MMRKLIVLALAACDAGAGGRRAGACPLRVVDGASTSTASSRRRSSPSAADRTGPRPNARPHGQHRRQRRARHRQHLRGHHRHARRRNSASIEAVKTARSGSADDARARAIARASRHHRARDTGGGAHAVSRGRRAAAQQPPQRRRLGGDQGRRSRRHTRHGQVNLWKHQRAGRQRSADARNRQRHGANGQRRPHRQRAIDLRRH